MRKLVFILLGCLCWGIGFAQKITLPTGVLTFHEAKWVIERPEFAKESYFKGTYYFAISFAQAPSRAQLELMHKNGITLKEKIYPFCYLVTCTQKPTAETLSGTGISGATLLNPLLKAFNGLALGKFPAYAQAGKNLVKVVVGVFDTFEEEIKQQAMQQAGLMLSGKQESKAGIYFGLLPVEKINAFCKLPFVFAVQPVSPPDTTLNGIGRGSSGTALLNAPVAQVGRGLLGTGITVGVGDDSDPTLHPDIRDRVISHTPGFPNNHGAHTAGTVAGAGILSPRHTGFAPKSTVISQWFSGVWRNATAYTTTYNMVVTNNSYGNIVADCEYAGVYDLYSRLLDQQAFDFPQLLHAFAAGNDGDRQCAPFPRAYRTVLGGYQSAKNNLTVGRTDYTQVSSSSSSSGPVKDGRLKPEITGLGIINSLNGAGTGYFTEFGTSMSSPNITGGLALLYERFRQLNSGTNPQGALMKVLLLNGARDVGIKGPDYRHGYGTMMLERSLRMLENKQFTLRSSSQGNVQDTIIQVPPGASQLKVMLYWHDPAANVLAPQTLVHNLDLEVITPSGQTVLPLILNPLPDAVSLAATPGIDQTNNHEQVVIENPLAGAYTLRVKGTEVLSLPTQPYAISFDIVPKEMRFTSPVNGQVVAGANQTFPIAWEDEGSPEDIYALSYSLDNGVNWTPINNNLKDTTRLFLWQPGTIRSNTTKLRLQKGTQTVESEPFSIIPNISFGAASSNDQCFSFFRINWTAITPQPGETIDYIVKLKSGPEMVNVDTISGQNFYILKNLHPDSLYYAAIVARINGVEGTYGSAISRRPNTGNCNGSISDGDLMIDSVVSPLSGRQFTTTALGNNQTLSIRVRNLDNVASGTYRVKYSINGGFFTTVDINGPIAARSTATIPFTGINFSSPGNYQITAVVEHTGFVDNNPANDTLVTIIRHLQNNPLNLTVPFSEDFEELTDHIAATSQVGLAGSTRWDYGNQDLLARARTVAFPGIARSGQKAITLDVSKAAPRVTNPFNRLEGTFNLSAYDVQNHEIRLNFHYKPHGVFQEPHPQNKVWVRGNDQQPWIELFSLGGGANGMAGSWLSVAGLNLAKKLADAGQNFSTSTQIRFGQFAQVSMADNENFAGYSFDDLELLLAENDVQLLSIISPEAENCNAGTQMSVKVRVVNNMPNAINNIPVRYRVNKGAWITENIGTIAGNDSLNYTFTTQYAFNQPGIYEVEAETQKAGDNIPANNLAAKTIVSQPIIQSFPYLQDFELTSGNFTGKGINNTWDYGTPASLRIHTAASGAKAWKTRLVGNYNDLEESYLYAPCFNISGLSKPMLSFSIAYQMEDCRNQNVVCDAVWLEYKLNGGVWTKLGRYGEGVNWYDFEPQDVWMADNATTWRDALIPLPIHTGTIGLRYVIRTDLSSTREGMAIDNFHIYNGDALPLDWLSFSATLQSDHVTQLVWRVANPNVGERFEIEVWKAGNYSQDTQKIGSISIANLEALFYTFQHRIDQKRGALFYRITWHKNNGTISYSPIRKIVTNQTDEKLLIYPNPAKTHLQIFAKTIDNQPVNISIISLDGKILYSEPAMPANGILQKSLQLASLNLPAGTYLVELKGISQKMITKWIKW